MIYIATIPNEEERSSLSEIIGNNFRQIRMTRKLSLDEVSSMTSVSKSMLSQFERGLKTPTITVLYKICEGMHVSFNSLLKKQLPSVQVVHEEELSRNGNLKVQVFFDHDILNPMEITKACILPHTRHPANSHGENVWEYVMVAEGVFTLILDEDKDERYVVKKGEALRFLANRHHIYANETDEEVWLHNITYFDD